MRSDTFYAATARQIAREFADCDPGPGLDAAPALPRSPLLPLLADAIDWEEMATAETIPAEGGDLRASTIAYRELAQAGYRGLHDLQHQHDQLQKQHARLRDELKALRPPLAEDASEPRPAPKQPRLPIAGLSGVRGVQGVRGL